MARSPNSAFRLRIQPVIESADHLIEHVAAQLPTHRGLARAARGVATAAREAERISKKLRRPWGTHRLPALFTIAILAVTGIWIYFHFFHISRLTLAVSRVDAVELKREIRHRVRLRSLETDGSSESLKLLAARQADLAFVQGGVEIPIEYPRTKLASAELVLFLVRDDATVIRKVLTSTKDQGSHQLAQKLMDIWERDVEFVHSWRALASSDQLPGEDIDAVLVVKDPANRRVATTLRRLQDNGFRLAPVYIGAKQTDFPYLEEVEVSSRYLDPADPRPPLSVPTYRVATYLVAHDDLTPRQLAIATSLIADDHELSREGFEPTFDAASNVLQGVEAILGVIVYVGVALLALFGLDIIAYRRRFNELNSLVSLISMHQSEKDVIFESAEHRVHNIRYLGACSDLLGLISVICGYYAQENTSLMYHRLFETIHDRCNGLKINIQLKILHSTVTLQAEQDAADL